MAEMWPKCFPLISINSRKTLPQTKQVPSAPLCPHLDFKWPGPPPAQCQGTMPGHPTPRSRVGDAITPYVYSLLASPLNGVACALWPLDSLTGPRGPAWGGQQASLGAPGRPHFSSRSTWLMRFVLPFLARVRFVRCWAVGLKSHSSPRPDVDKRLPQSSQLPPCCLSPAQAALCNITC